VNWTLNRSEGKPFVEEICQAVEDRWHIEYQATNNAVLNGGLVAACLWFGQGDFLKTVNLAAHAADFTDADCNAAAKECAWQSFRVDLREFANRETRLRIYQRVLLANRTAGNAYWRNLRIE